MIGGKYRVKLSPGEDREGQFCDWSVDWLPQEGTSERRSVDRGCAHGLASARMAAVDAIDAHKRARRIARSTAARDVTLECGDDMDAETSLS